MKIFGLIPHFKSMHFILQPQCGDNIDMHKLSNCIMNIRGNIALSCEQDAVKEKT